MDRFIAWLRRFLGVELDILSLQARINAEELLTARYELRIADLEKQITHLRNIITARPKAEAVKARNWSQVKHLMEVNEDVTTS